MKLELTDKQINDVLENLSDSQLYAFLASRRVKGFKMFLALLRNQYNTESCARAVEQVLYTMPIQKELF